MNRKFINYLKIKNPSKLVLAYILIMGLPIWGCLFTDLSSSFLIKECKAILSVIFLIVPIHLVLPQKINRVLLIVSIAFFGSVSLIEIFHISIFGALTNQNIFYTLFETNHLETSEFIATYLKFQNIAIISFIVLGALTIWVTCKNKIPSYNWLNILLIFVSIYTLASLVKKGRIRSIDNFAKHGPLKIISALYEYSKERKLFLATSSITFSPDYVEKIKSKNSEEELVVIIIGESASRKHWGLYGYNRETTPLLSKRNIIKFNNVVSPHSHTLQSLAKVLTFASHDFPDAANNAPDIVTLANLAGYETYWISNQAALGAFETKTTYIANKAAQKFFLNNLGEIDESGQPKDAVILEALEESLSDNYVKRKVVFIHLLGSHLRYQERYPKKYDVFQNKPENKIDLGPKEVSVINSYDNSILYTDWVLDQIFQQIDKSEVKNKLAVYFSDHGEEVFEYRKFSGHSEVIQSNFMFEIPFIFYIPKTSSFSSLVPQLISNTDKLYSIEDFIHTFHHIIGIKSKKLIEERSLLSGKFEETPRKVGTRFYKKEVYEFRIPSLRNDLNFPQKFMAHRTNTVEKFELLKNKYLGFEVDVMVKPDFFDVHHPPVVSKNINFEEYLKKDEFRRHYFWLDCKNLTDDNVVTAIRLLKQLDEKYDIKRRIIFESSIPEPLEKISKLGFFTSWYLPEYSGESKIHEIAYISKIVPRLSSSFSAISQNQKVVPILKKYLGKVDIITWGVGSENDSRKASRQKELMADANIKLLLFTERTPFDR